jgi:hypothetical protein
VFGAGAGYVHEGSCVLPEGGGLGVVICSMGVVQSSMVEVWRPLSCVDLHNTTARV